MINKAGTNNKAIRITVFFILVAVEFDLKFNHRIEI